MAHRMKIGRPIVCFPNTIGPLSPTENKKIPPTDRTHSPRTSIFPFLASCHTPLIQPRFAITPSSKPSAPPPPSSSHLYLFRPLIAVMGLANPRTILVAVDEGEHSMYALEWALDTLLVRRQPNDKIIILYAKPAYSSLSGPAFVLTTDAVEAIERFQNQIASEVIDSAKQICAEREVYAQIKTMVGDPRDVIQETADKLKADFLVMGSHGFGALKRALLGSVSDYCAHNVKCPVIIVRKTHQ